MSEQMTESEMRAFFERLISSFVAASDTHKKLEVLSANYDETQRRVTEVSSANAQLKQELYTTVTERDKARNEASDNKALADIYRNEREQARNALHEMTTKANENSARLAEFESRERALVGERDMWRTTAEHMSSDRDHWRTRSLENDDNYAKLETAYAELKEKHAKLGSFLKDMFDEGPVKIEHKQEEYRPLPSTTPEQPVGQGSPTSESPYSNPSQVSTSEAIDPLPHFTPPGYQEPGSSSGEAASVSTSEQSSVETGHTEGSSPSQESSPGDRHDGWRWNFDIHDYAYYVNGEVKENTHDEFFPDGRKNPAYIPF